MLSFLIYIWIGVAVRATTVYTPPSHDPKTARVLVVLHGCLQSAESMALGAGFNAFAEASNLVVLYPQVPSKSHPLDCWSWYEPVNQRPDSGQLRVLIEEIRRLRTTLGISEDGVYVVGISSGAAMAAGLAACFPDEVRGVALHSGPSYALADDLKSAERVLKQGPSRVASLGPCKPQEFKGKVLVIQGTADPVVNPAHAERVIKDFVGLDKAVSATLGRANRLFFSQSEYVGPRAKGRMVMVHGLNHAWSGAIPTSLLFFSDHGPNATQLIVDYFK